MKRAWRAAIFAGGCAICISAVALYFRATATAGQDRATVESIVIQDVSNVFASEGLKQERRPTRVFVIKKGDPGGVIEDFKAADGDKLRIAGFGLTRAEAAMALMRQQDRDIVLALPGGPSIKLLDTSIGSLRDDNFQLELDRRNLVQTFADDFKSFSWRAEGLSPKEDGRGTWRTHYGWQGVEGEGSHSLPGEAQVYVDPAFKGTSVKPLGFNPFRVSNGVLEIRADRAPEQALPYIWGRRYTSGIITSKFSFGQLYGVFEIRARMPAGQGFWPAFWLLPVDGSWPPEIDVLEVLGHDPKTLYASVHSKATGEHTAAGVSAPVADLSRDFHVYAVDWQKDRIKWYLDGVEIGRASTPSDMHKPMHLLANLAVGGGWAGEPDSTTQFPGIFAIDWIRAYRRDR